MVDPGTPERIFKNPFRPGAGHMPPVLAGREGEKEEFHKYLQQKVITDNVILTGLRGVGKTVLLETLKPIAVSEGWLWVGTDLSESTSVSEATMALRLLTDLSVISSTIEAPTGQLPLPIGFSGLPRTFTYDTLEVLYNNTPGLVADKLKTVLEAVWRNVSITGKRGIIFAYDEAQTLSDHAQKEQYPLSTVLDVFQSVQRKGLPLMLVLTGLPTLLPKCVQARTFSERMFRQIFLEKLNREDSRRAILEPVEKDDCPIYLHPDSVEQIIHDSGGYPYFIQFICREVFDLIIQELSQGEDKATVPTDAIFRKLDADFFAGRWSKATDRQRQLLYVAAKTDHAGSEFTVQELVEKSRVLLKKPFSNSHVNQMLVFLADAGLIYKNRYGKYSFAVPLLDKFILRQPDTIAP